MPLHEVQNSFFFAVVPMMRNVSTVRKASVIPSIPCRSLLFVIIGCASLTLFQPVSRKYVAQMERKKTKIRKKTGMPSFARPTESAARRCTSAIQPSRPNVRTVHTAATEQEHLHIAEAVGRPLRYSKKSCFQSTPRDESEIKFQSRLCEMVHELRLSLEASLTTEVAVHLTQRSQQDRMRNVYCGLDAIIEEPTKRVGEESSPLPLSPKEGNHPRGSSVGSSLTPTTTTSRCILSLDSQATCRDDDGANTPQPVDKTPRPHRYSPGNHSCSPSSTISPMRTEVLGALHPSPARCQAEDIDQSSDDEAGTVHYGGMPFSHPNHLCGMSLAPPPALVFDDVAPQDNDTSSRLHLLGVQDDGQCLVKQNARFPTLDPTSVDHRTVETPYVCNDTAHGVQKELEDFMRWDAVHAQAIMPQLPPLFGDSVPHAPLRLHHTDDANGFIQWIAGLNMYDLRKYLAEDDEHIRNIISATVVEVLRDAALDVAIDVLLHTQ